MLNQRKDSVTVTSKEERYQMAAVVDFNMVLESVGIAKAAQRTNVRQNIGSVEDLSSLTAKSISDLVDDLRRRTSVALGKYNMPLVVQKCLKNAIEWIHDFQRTGNVLLL